MTLADLTPEIVARLEAERKAKIVANDKIFESLAKERSELNAFLAQKRANSQKPVQSTRKQHICTKCGGTIPTKSQAEKRIVIVGFGWPEGYHRVTKYSHVECPKIAEVIPA